MTNKVKPAKSKDKVQGKDKVKSVKEKVKVKGKKLDGKTKKRNVFKVVDGDEDVEDKKNKPETDEDFHKIMMKENSKKSKKKSAKAEPIKLLLDDEDDDFDFDDDEGDENSGGDDDSAEDGDYANFMEEMGKIDGRRQRIGGGGRSEGTGEVAEYNLGTRGGKVRTTPPLTHHQ